MRFHKLTATELLKAIGIGIATALLLSAVMVPALRLGISPLPRPLGLAFAETVLGRSLPLPVGLLFHVAYVTVWSVVYVALFRHARFSGTALPVRDLTVGPVQAELLPTVRIQCRRRVIWHPAR